MVVRELRGDEEWLANPGWVARQGVRSFAGLPIAAAGRILGVLVLFSRQPFSEQFIDDLAFLAEFTATRLLGLRRAEDRAAEVLTRSHLRLLEKQSIEAALRHAGGKVFGRNGAAEILGMKPTTLASRLKALGIALR
jgi:transcriptional regulator with GAF, ATPase, and Fis domain